MLGPIGKRHLELAVKWIPSLMTYGSASALTIMYMTDWKTVLIYVPFYGGKYKEED